MADTMSYYDSPLTGEELDAALRKIPQIDASVQAAANSAKLSQSWAEGGTGTRTGEDINNAKYWCGKAQQATQFDPASYYTKAQADTRYQMPVGYIFDWAPVSGSSVDLSTAAKVAAYFGYGTWKEISGRFTFGRDSTHTAGSTGGEAEHTLTTSEMPSHQHIPQYDGNFFLLNPKTASEITKGFAEGGLWPNVPKGQTHTTSSVGGDQPHNNMPPYLAVYKWQRIA